MRSALAEIITVVYFLQLAARFNDVRVATVSYIVLHFIPPRVSDA